MTYVRRNVYEYKHLGKDTETTSSRCECELIGAFPRLRSRHHTDPRTGPVTIQTACGENSGCVNRGTKVECDNACRWGSKCQNKRITLGQQASLLMFNAGDKGHGLKATTALAANTFLIEYVGEVITAESLKQRRSKYRQAGYKHEYVMLLTKEVFIDATVKGNIARYFNHSCNPNCFIERWHVGGKVRIGVFTTRDVNADEELCFDYNTDGDDLSRQRCLCGELNCKGVIGVSRSSLSSAVSMPTPPGYTPPSLQPQEGNPPTTLEDELRSLSPEHDPRRSSCNIVAKQAQERPDNILRQNQVLAASGLSTCPSRSSLDQPRPPIQSSQSENQTHEISGQVVPDSKRTITQPTKRPFDEITSDNGFIFMSFTPRRCMTIIPPRDLLQPQPILHFGKPVSRIKTLIKLTPNSGGQPLQPQPVIRIISAPKHLQN